jgi:hypothetical protein
LRFEDENIEQVKDSCQDGEENQGQDFLAEQQDFIQPKHNGCAPRPGSEGGFPETSNNGETRGWIRVGSHGYLLSKPIHRKLKTGIAPILWEECRLTLQLACFIGSLRFALSSGDDYSIGCVSHELRSSEKGMGGGPPTHPFFGNRSN